MAIQGERGSYSEAAVRLLLGEEADPTHCDRFEDVFRETEEGRADYSLVPIENSLSGSIHKNYDLLRRYALRIVREINLEIDHSLIACPGTRFEDLEVVVSHPVALDQCERFFEDHPGLKKQIGEDTSGSVRKIMEEGRTSWGAIAGQQAAEVFGGEILMTGIQDDPENFTRFFLLAAGQEPPPEADKTSIAFSFKNLPGALFKCLSVFALRDIDLSKIESRPIRGRPWEYLFYLDFSGNTSQPEIRNALGHLKELTEFVEVLGSYPRDTQLEKKRM